MTSEPWWLALFSLAIFQLIFRRHHPVWCVILVDAFNLGITMGTPRALQWRPNSKEDPMETDFGPKLPVPKSPKWARFIPKLMNGGWLLEEDPENMMISTWDGLTKHVWDLKTPPNPKRIMGYCWQLASDLWPWSQHSMSQVSDRISSSNFSSSTCATPARSRCCSFKYWT